MGVLAGVGKASAGSEALPVCLDAGLALAAFLSRESLQKQSCTLLSLNAVCKTAS